MLALMEEPCFMFKVILVWRKTCFLAFRPFIQTLRRNASSLHVSSLNWDKVSQLLQLEMTLFLTIKVTRYTKACITQSNILIFSKKTKSFWKFTKFPINSFKTVLTLVMGVFHNGTFSITKIADFKGKYCYFQCF